ncbi:alpha/beta hydrolase [Mycobacterium sp. 21AC1]|uniref:alpha/beta fold hydrolase n=1 Tax=[Mycobacterium] appelbergii TaxID=2939269 RepID=UPI002938DDF8|nr:alpha/beta hydrolase [Mycobacterium sp. 21AC1]MDV3124499.1 alpha/beta hydrolase [Mycobacterium sp. 21AC1]
MNAAPQPAFVFIHGGKFDARCWQPTITEMEQRSPHLWYLSANLPGRQDIPADVRTLTIAECVDSVVGQIEQAGLDDVILVGHSLAGVVIPDVAARLGARRVQRTILLACNVPPDGKSVVSTLKPPIRFFARMNIDRLPVWMARWMFCNGMTDQQREHSLRLLVPESLSIVHEPVDRSRMPMEVPRTWILTLRDHVLPVDVQRRFIANLGGVDEVIELDTCHNAMISEPAELASILLRHLAVAPTPK